MKLHFFCFIVYIRYRTIINKYSEKYEQKVNVSTPAKRVLTLISALFTFLFLSLCQPIYTLATRVESPEVMPQPSSASVSSAWDWEEIYPP